MTAEQRKAIRRICEDFGFENLKELRAFMRDNFGDPLDLELWDKTESGLYAELERLLII